MLLKPALHGTGQISAIFDENLFHQGWEQVYAIHPNRPESSDCVVLFHIWQKLAIEMIQHRNKADRICRFESL